MPAKQVLCRSVCPLLDSLQSGSCLSASLPACLSVCLLALLGQSVSCLALCSLVPVTTCLSVCLAVCLPTLLCESVPHLALYSLVSVTACLSVFQLSSVTLSPALLCTVWFLSLPVCLSVSLSSSSAQSVCLLLGSLQSGSCHCLSVFQLCSVSLSPAWLSAVGSCCCQSVCLSVCLLMSICCLVCLLPLCMSVL